MDRKTILIADDDVNLMRALAVRLEAEGYRCICTQDGYFAVAQALKEQPDLLLLDVNMPAGDGFSVRKRLLEATPPVKTPVVYITGERFDAVSESAASLGASHVLPKPFETGELLACIREAIAA